MKIEKIYEILLNILKFKFIDLLSSIPAINEIKNAYKRWTDIIRGKLNSHSKGNLVFR